MLPQALRVPSYRTETCTERLAVLSFNKISDAEGGAYRGKNHQVSVCHETIYLKSASKPETQKTQKAVKVLHNTIESRHEEQLQTKQATTQPLATKGGLTYKDRYSRRNAQTQ
jgi:hypothetical protein